MRDQAKRSEEKERPRVPMATEGKEAGTWFPRSEKQGQGLATGPAHRGRRGAEQVSGATCLYTEKLREPWLFIRPQEAK